MKPYKVGEILKFTYNLETKIAEHEEKIVEKYGLKRFYENMPDSFAQEVVNDEDKTAYLEMYEKINNGELFATCDFRVKGSNVWSRVTLYREGDDSSLVLGFVQDVSEVYEYVINQAVERDSEKQRRLVMEKDYVRLVTAVKDAYNMVLFGNLTKNTYHSINGSVYDYAGVEEEGNLDELLAMGIKNVPKEFKDIYKECFSRELLLKAYENGEKEKQVEYQYMVNPDGEPSWINSHVIFVDDPYENDILTIVLSQNIDIRKRKEKEEEQIRKNKSIEALQLMSGITSTFELIISANLTQNTFYLLNYEHAVNSTAGPDGEFDTLIAVGESTVPDAQKENFRNSFSREALLKAYAEGKKDVYLEHQQYDVNGVVHWVSTHVIFTENPYNDDILEITLSQNIDERVEKDENQRALEVEAVQLMSGITGTFDILIFSNLSKNSFKMKRYDRKTNELDEKEGEYDFLIEHGVSRVPDDQKDIFYNTFCKESVLKAREEGKTGVYLDHQQYDDYGELHWLSTNVFFTENPYNDDILTITLSQNIDERKNAEEEHFRMISDALNLAESASRAKSDFLSRMSHDIRTPMNAVIGYATIAATHLDERERVKDSLKKILSSGEHLQGLINDVLDMSRIEAGKESLNLVRASISEMIRTVLPMIHSQISQKHIELYVDTIDVTDEFVYADAQKMRQLLLNILGNAAKFTSDGGNISVKIRQNKSQNKGYAVYTFYIKDNGIGMSKEFQKHLFETFSQERTSTNSKQLGTGLGMAIAKNYVDMMNGTISVESEVGKGTEFAVKLEFKLQEDVKPDVRLEQLKGYRALVVDDDFQSCESVVHLLQDIGMRADFTTSGKEALFRTQMACGENDSYFAYIIDWIMPDMNGIELVRRIRKIIGDEVPIIILTAYYWGDIEEEARDAGVTAFCTKPLFTSDLTGVFLQHESISEEHSDFKGERILLVEDNDFNREIAEFMLKEIGFDVDTACDGQDAVAVMNDCKDGEYDYILMDVQMPIMDGIEATKEIRESDREYLKSVPIIALTANAFVEDVDKCLKAGMNAHLSKPFKITDITEVVNSFKRK